MYLHDMPTFKEFIEATARELGGIDPVLVEKDYWIMHCLWGLKVQGFEFYMKGGTSLSKGFGIIDRFSEDIDIMITPPGDLGVKTGRNHMKEAHIESRSKYYDYLRDKIKIDGLIEVVRDKEFDDDKMRNGGLRLMYPTNYESIPDLKDGILLEVGFDKVHPNKEVDITSWLMDKTKKLNRLDKFKDNTAIKISCYLPEYTFVEKLQTISRKYRLQQLSGDLPTNFMRHYYDIYQLLDEQVVLDFIGCEDYLAHKDYKFKTTEEKDLTKNDAFIIKDTDTRAIFEKAFKATEGLYYRDRPTLVEILKRIEVFLEKL